MGFVGVKYVKMAKGKDPAFLFYPGSASEDTQFMNRLERGAYFDLLKAQKKFQKFTLLLVKKVLGSDFDACWPAIESVLEKDGDMYFIGWVNDAIENRKEHSEKQKKRIQEYWDKKNKTKVIPESFHGNTTELPLVNESKNENEIINEDYKYNFKEPDENSHPVVIVPREATDLLGKIVDYFAVKPDVMNPVYDTVNDFVETVHARGELKNLTTAFSKYVEYKARSQETRHSIATWIGTKENHYTDGHWNTTDWNVKLKNSNTHAPIERTTTAASAVIQPGKRFR